MKSLFLLSLIFSFTHLIAQDCNTLTMTELINASKLDEYDLETFALENGFYYDATDRSYRCEEQINYAVSKSSIAREEMDSMVVFSYSFYDKAKYLEFKKELPKEFIIETSENETGKYIKYFDISNDIIILLKMATITEVDFVDVLGTKNLYMIQFVNFPEID